MPDAVSGDAGVLAHTSIGVAVGAGGTSVIVTGNKIRGLSQPKAVA